ncbi:MAG: hypothetical protein ACYTKD_28755 [Planctomycetota bacterium]|jgi:hypothetical protein
MPTKDAVKKRLADLAGKGKALLQLLKKAPGNTHARFATAYQRWYTEALAAVKTLAPDRADEFTMYYVGSPPRRTPGPDNYGVQHYLRALTLPRVRGFDRRSTTHINIFSQLTIVKALSTRINSALADIEGSLFAGLVGAELEAAAKLMRVNLRAAGAVAGIVLETHLSKVASQHGVKSQKKSPGISGWNDALKNAKVYPTPVWRRIQFLGDLRNQCCHKTPDEPTRDGVRDLLDGVSWVCGT